MNDDCISRKAALDIVKRTSGDYATAFCEISRLPASDARPVVYAEPVRIFNDPYTGRMFTTCSRCTGKISPKDKFCKHCGADMRGKKVCENE